MGQVQVRVVLTHHRGAVMAQFGQLDANRVHHYETEALIDPGATHSVSPSAVADRLGLFWIRRPDAQYADSRIKWYVQPERRSPSWAATIRTTRRQMARLQRDTPSLNRRVIEAMWDETLLDALGTRPKAS